MHVKLNEICEIIPGYAFKSKDFVKSGFPVIKITNICPPYVDSNSCSYVKLSNYNKSKLNKYIVERDDTLLAMTGASIGKIGRVLSGKFYINQRVAKFTLKSGISKKYLHYILSTDKFFKYIQNNVDSSSAQPNISASSIGRYDFNLHNENLQQHIVNTISSLLLKSF